MTRRRLTFVSTLIYAAIVAILVAVAVSACDDPPTVGTYHDERSCTAEGGVVHEHMQFGGKYNTSTWWCTDSNGNITGLWFQS